MSTRSGTDWATLHRCAAAFPTHTTLDPDQAARANQLRPLPAGRWLDVDAQPGDRHTGRATTATRITLVVDVVERLAACRTQHAPPGRLAATRGAEAVLARACVVLTDWETAYRTGHLPDHTAPLYADPDITAPDLLDAVPDHQVAELVEPAACADRAGALPHLAGGSPARCSSSTGPTATSSPPPPTPSPPTARPPATGWCCLTSRPSPPSATPTGSPVGCGSCSPTPGSTPAGDRYRIHGVGLYLARHGALITWPPDRFAAALLDGGPTSASRPPRSAGAPTGSSPPRPANRADDRHESTPARS